MAIYKLLMERRSLIIASVLFMVLTCLLPIRRPIYVWQDAHIPFFAFLCNWGQYIFMVIFVYITFILYMSKPLQRFMDYVTQPKFIAPILYITIISTFVLFVLRMPGIWWTWGTVGLHCITVILFPVILHGRISTGKAFCLGAGMTFLLVGIWELPYQYWFWLVHEVPQGITIDNFLEQVKFMRVFIFFGAYIVIFILLKEYKNLKFNKLAIVPAAYTIFMLAAWRVTGFWCDITFDWSTNTWHHTDFNYLSLILYRSTKVSIALIPLVWLSYPLSVWRDRTWRK